MVRVGMAALHAGGGVPSIYWACTKDIVPNQLPLDAMWDLGEIQEVKIKFLNSHG